MVRAPVRGRVLVVHENGPLEPNRRAVGNVNRRALGALDGMSLVEGGEERQGVAAVLNAAALTYVAAALSAVALLLYYGLLIFGGRRS